LANVRTDEQMSRFMPRGKTRVSTQRRLFCLAHNVEKIANRAMHRR
jgi:hypothetical protein